VFFKGQIFFFFDQGHASKSRLFKPQFQELIGLPLQQLHPHPYERSFHLEFNNELNLFFKCHGRKSNIVLFENNETLKHFRKNIENDQYLKLNESYRNIELKYNPDAVKNETSLTNEYPFFPKDQLPKLLNASESQFFETIQDLRTLTALSFDDTELFPNKGSSILEDINRFSATYLSTHIFNSKKESLNNSVSQAIASQKKLLHSAQSAYESLLNKRPYDEIGNTILANLHQIQNGQKSVKVTDIYTGKEIEIELNPKISSIENAEVYFKKEKGKPQQLAILKQKIEESTHKLNALETKLQSIQTESQLKKLKTFESESDQKEKEQILPFKKFEIDGFEVFVGKNANSNDKMLSHYSDKNDLWLHAKDVSGSHVLIKVKKNKKLNDSTLEKAASLAAYYSKNRNQSLVTVIYTPRKFVRKIKGADKGKVTVQNEKTLLVVPNKQV
jgi:predicted ribosome quality control (RQC) complex YloA/Tae2 family protein